jgi:hypothetical protein
LVRSDWTASVTRNQASDQPESGPIHYNAVHPNSVQPRLDAHRSSRCPLGADRLVSTPHYKRSVFLALGSRLERELIAALLKADSETCVCEFTPDGTEPTLWNALYSHLNASWNQDQMIYVLLDAGVQWEATAHRLLTEFNEIKILSHADILSWKLEP